MEAGSLTHCAIDIHCFSAIPADEMMVIITHPILIPSGRSRGLNPPD